MCVPAIIIIVIIIEFVAPYGRNFRGPIMEWRHERTEHLDIFLFSTHNSMVFHFQCSVYWWKGSVRF